MGLQELKNHGDYLDGFSQGLRSAFRSGKRSSSTLGFAAVSFVFLVLSANPEYSLQMIYSGKILTAVHQRLTGLVITSGYSAVVLNLFFSLLVGVTFTNTVVQLGMKKFNSDLAGSIPGFLAGGCASCGVGILSVIGFGGVLASLPFQGNLLRTGGILILGILIVRTGNPETCKL